MAAAAEHAYIAIPASVDKEYGRAAGTQAVAQAFGIACHFQIEPKLLGRPQMTKDDIPQIFYRHYPAYVKGELNISELARVCDLSRNTVYKYVGLLEG